MFWQEYLNPFLWAWIVLTPYVLLSRRFDDKLKNEYLRFYVAVIACYVMMNLSVSLKWKIRTYLASTSTEKELASADGANQIFAFFFAWIPSMIYAGFIIATKRMLAIWKLAKYS